MIRMFTHYVIIARILKLAEERIECGKLLIQWLKFMIFHKIYERYHLHLHIFTRAGGKNVVADGSAYWQLVSGRCCQMSDGKGTWYRFCYHRVYQKKGSPLTEKIHLVVFDRFPYQEIKDIVFYLWGFHFLGGRGSAFPSVCVSIRKTPYLPNLVDHSNAAEWRQF